MLSVELPVFQQNRECTACVLHETARNVCVPSRPIFIHRSPAQKTALYVLGDYPGFTEDLKNVSFSGSTGRYLEALYLAPGRSKPSLWNFHDYADVYVGNAIRCIHASDGEPPALAIGACRQYWVDDIARLQAIYDEVVVLCVGTVATKTILGCKVTKSFSRQGSLVAHAPLRPVRVFSTYNPGILFRRKNPARIYAIVDHLLLVRDYLSTGLRWHIPPDFASPARALGPPDFIPDAIAYDIETYGALQRMPEQKHFHPHRSVVFDGVKREDLIQTAAIGLRRPDGKLISTSFVWANPSDRYVLRQWFEFVREHQIPVVGQKVTFDIAYTRYAQPDWALSLLADDSFPLEDVMGWNYLQNEMRPERSLKALSYLLGITEYRRTLAHSKFDSILDPALHRYNAEDCLATIVAREMLISRIAEDYGEDHPKLSPATRRWYSELLWMCITLMETGVGINVPYLQQKGREAAEEQMHLLASFREKYNLPLAGENSRKTVLVLTANSLRDSGLQQSKDLKQTKSHAVAFDRQNRSMFMAGIRERATTAAPDWEGHTTLEQLKMFSEYKALEKLRSSYVEPFINLSHASIVYPQWYPFPSLRSKDSDDDSLGTKGSRITCNEPAIQTTPRKLKNVYRSRFPGGFVLGADQSQIELRTVGLLSWDDTYVAAYRDGVDLHRETAMVVFGDDCVTHPDFDEVYRQGGKRTNFLMIYRGGAKRLHQTYLEFLNLDVPIIRCAEIIQNYFKKYAGLEVYHQSLLQDAVRKGYTSELLLGVTRRVAGSKKTLLDTYESMIVNVPIQATAANIQISAQKVVIRALKRGHFQSVCCHQQYDSLYVDGPAHEYEPVVKIVSAAMVNPPYYQKLCDSLGRTLPLAVDIKTSWRTD